MEQQQIARKFSHKLDLTWRSDREFSKNSQHDLTEKPSPSTQWIEMETEFPHCIYYFGPFASCKEAQAELAGYLEDLEQEGAKVTAFQIKECEPKELTIVSDGDSNSVSANYLLPFLKRFSS